VLPRYHLVGYETGESELCKGCCCCCAKQFRSNNLLLHTSQKININLGLFGSIQEAVTFDIQTDGNFDQEELRNYVYGAVIERSAEIHAANHLIHGGLSDKLDSRDELVSFLTPTRAQVMARDKY
jgi:hypothetical protein